MAGRRATAGLIVDFGGVLTSSVGDAFETFCRREAIDPEALKGVVKSAYGVGTEPDALVSMMETGRIDQGEFQRRMAAALASDLETPVPAEGLLSRMLADIHFDVPMVVAVRDLRGAGTPTALLSNSCGVLPEAAAAAPVRRGGDLGRGGHAEAPAPRCSGSPPIASGWRPRPASSSTTRKATSRRPGPWG